MRSTRSSNDDGRVPDFVILAWRPTRTKIIDAPPSLNVGHDPLHGDAVTGEERPGPAQEPGAGGSAFVGQNLDVGQPGVIVHGDVDVVVAHPRAAFGRVGLGAWAWALSRPWTRQPPPGRIRPSFLTSTWISSPGRSRS